MSELMTEAEALAFLKEKGSLFLPEDGFHFQGISGKHLEGYCNIDPVMPFALIVSKMTETLVDKFKDDDVDTVFVPATGAIPLAAWGPYHLNKINGKDVLGVWADKIKPRGFIIERDGFVDAIKGKRVLILEDMVNQMYSVKELVRLVEEAGGTNVGVGSMVSNANVTAEAIGVPKFFTLATFAYRVWDQADCELCAKKVPIVTDMGHGDDFAEEHPDYPTTTVLV
jgi:orotate phosphoribosyltransferase